METSSVTESDSSEVVSREMDFVSELGLTIKGPSSSHTAGPCLIGNEVYKRLGGCPQEATIILYNSMGDCGNGHNTPGALGAGLNGEAPSSDAIVQAARNLTTYLRKVGLKMILKRDHDPSKHPNTIEISAKRGKQALHLIGVSLGGGRVEIAILKQILDKPQDISEQPRSNWAYAS